MPNISQSTTDLVLFFAQVFAVYVVIAISLYNLTLDDITNKDLWVSLLSSSVGYLLPSPIMTQKNVLSST